jgi:thiol-disulfide isomerase/thioredoxin
MRTPLRSSGLAAALLAVVCGMGMAATRDKAPDFTHTASSDWINSAPLKLSSLRGSVVLIEFWAFDCVNCRNTLPWLEAVNAEYSPRGLKIISVHTPELKQEYVPANVRRVVKELGISYPVMIDRDYSYWTALNNRYWPAFYLVDGRGRIVQTALGEMHRGDPRGDALEAAIREQLEHVRSK